MSVTEDLEVSGAVKEGRRSREDLGLQVHPCGKSAVTVGGEATSSRAQDLCTLSSPQDPPILQMARSDLYCGSYLKSPLPHLC